MTPVLVQFYSVCVFVSIVRVLFCSADLFWLFLDFKFEEVFLHSALVCLRRPG